MASSKRPIPVAVLRDAVRLRVAASSLRQVAGEIELSFSGLRSFLAGGRPQPRTIEKLRTWYERQEPVQRMMLFLEATLLSTILEFPEDVWRTLPKDRQLAFAEVVLRLGREAFSTIDLPVPETLAKLSAEDLLRLKASR